MSIRNKLVAILLLFSIIPVLAYGIITITSNKKTIEEHLCNSSLAFSHLAVQRIHEYLYSQYEDILVFSKNKVMYGVSASDKHVRISQYLESLTHDHREFFYAICFNEKGNIIASSKNDLIGINMSSDPLFQEAIKGKSHINDPGWDTPANAYVLFVSVPIYATQTPDKVVGVFAAALKWEKIHEMISELSLMDKKQDIANHVMLTNKDGLVISCSDKDELFTDNLINAKLESAVKAQEKKEGSIAEITEHGLPSFSTYTYFKPYKDLPPLDWLLILEQNPDRVFATINTSKKVMLTILSFIILPLIAGSVFFARRMSNPILVMASKIKLIGKGQWVEKMPVSSTKELGTLAESFNTLTDELQQSKKEQALVLKRNHRRMNTQKSIAITLSEANTLEDFSQKIIQALCGVLEWDLGEIWAVDHNNNVLKLSDYWHVPSLLVPEFISITKQITFAPGIGLPGRVWESKKPTWISDVTKDANFPRFHCADKEGLHGAFGFPILCGNECLGVMNFFSHEIMPPDEDLLTMLDTVGAQIGLFMKRKQVEQEKEILREQFYHAQKMESVGRLAGGVAHDFNNMLMAIIGYASLAEMELENNDPARGFLQKLLDSADKATKVTQSLLAFSRIQPVSFEPLNLNKVIENMGTLLPKITCESVACHLNINAQDCFVLADTDKLEQVLMNIVKNAVDAMPGGGDLTISTGVVVMDGTFAKRYGLEKAGRYGTITISDTGIGMDDDTKGKIFEPFFTTKDKWKGTGLGLSIAYGIIKQHQGHIAVASEPNKGTMFTIYLPLTETAATETAAKPITKMTASSKTGTETILIAEDERRVRDVLTNILECNGYKTLVAVDGVDAVVKFTGNKDAIQMLVFDVMMPNKDGKAAYNAIKEIKPDIKVLFLSGYSDDITINKTIHNAGLPFMQKPVSPEKLLRKMREILDA